MPDLGQTTSGNPEVADDEYDEAYYTANYRDYERQSPPRKMQHYRDAVRRYLPPAETVRILDLGCAFGNFLGALDPQWEAYGADVSEYAVRWARAQLPRATFAVIHERAVPFDLQFQAITAFDVVEHVHQLDAWAEDISDHLVAGGIFFFVVPVYDGPLGPLVMALDKDPTHINKHPRAFWIDWARQHFELREWWGAFRYLLPGGLYVHWPTRALRAIAPAIAVMARRR